MKRHFWIQRIEEAFSQKSVVWLSGVRRAGKTTLAKSLDGVAYYDCELPRVRTQIDDAELFFSRAPSNRIVLDEIHRLSNPSEVLKIAADHFPKLQVLATGSSTLTARRKFRDTLTGRKREVWLTPMTLEDMIDFAKVPAVSIEHRMLHGGLPPFFLSPKPDDVAYMEWMDSYWAKDVQELFVIEKRSAFFKMIELLFHQSGELFEAQALTAPCELSRQTVINYLSVLESTLLATVIRPYAGVSASEITHQPKVFMFDTGFVCFFKGWSTLHDTDRGHLLEHLVLNQLHARYGRSAVFYWRDKQGHEVDFIVKTSRGDDVLAIECKAKASKFDPASLRSFRGRHPKGNNLLVVLDAIAPSVVRFGELEVQVVPLWALATGQQSQA